MGERGDICSLEDIKSMVDTFYSKVRKDDLLGPIFNGKIGDRWPEHLEKMYRFWQTALLEEYTYQGRPFPPHAQLPVNKEHFDRWVVTFHGTVDELFVGQKAEEAKSRAKSMADMFRFKIDHFRSAQGIKPIQ